MNNAGYQNLMRLSSLANLEGFYYRPRIDRQLLEKHSEGLIVLSGCIGGEVSDALRQDQYEQAEKTARWYKSVFGDRYYIELMDHGHIEHPKSWREQTDVNQELLKIAAELDIEAVLTCDAHYLMHEDKDAQNKAGEVLRAVKNGEAANPELDKAVRQAKQAAKNLGKYLKS
jgi:DNA polymerase-3 subunit alpha